MGNAQAGCPRHVKRAAHLTLDEIHALTAIDPWFLAQIKQIVDEEDLIHRSNGYGGRRNLIDSGPIEKAAQSSDLRALKRRGFSDRQIAHLAGNSESETIRAARKALGILPTYRLVDTCAAEFEAYTPYYYSTYGDENEARDAGKRKIMILGGGPNRIGQGIEFDYCCVHASFALKELGYETIMVNSNPETVSTDYDTSDKLFFEPLTLEDVLNICEQEKPEGVIVQFGGQTPLNLAARSKSPACRSSAPHRAISNSPRTASSSPHCSTNSDLKQRRAARRPTKTKPRNCAPDRLSGSGPSVLCARRPGDEDRLQRNRTRQLHARAVEASPDRPVLVDRFLEDATEVDVDLHLGRRDDGHRRDHGAHRAGRHALGDSACVIPAFGFRNR